MSYKSKKRSKDITHLSKIISYPEFRRGIILASFVITGFAVSLAPAGAHAQTNTETQRVLLKMRDGVEPHPQGVLASYQNRSTVKTMPLKALGIVILEVPADWNADELIEALVKDPAVEYGARDQPVRGQSVRPGDLNHDPDPNNRQWGLDGVRPTDMDVNAPRAWAYTTGSTEVVVAVLDSGIDHTNPDLRDNLWVNEAEMRGLPDVDDDGNGFVDDVHGYDFRNNDGDPWDDSSHGTAVAGTLAAQGNNGLGTVGVAWNARLMPIKVLGRRGTGSISDVLQAFSYLVTMTEAGVAIRVANASLSFEREPLIEEFLIATFDRLRENGTLLIVAAGNDRVDLDRNSDIAALPTFEHDNLIAVAASNRDGSRWSDSNYGLTSVDLAAPGSGIYSPRSRIENFGTDQTRNTGLLFDDAGSDEAPNSAENWRRVEEFIPGFTLGSAYPMDGTAWTNDATADTVTLTIVMPDETTRRQVTAIAALTYGPFDLTAFPPTQNYLIVNFKLARFPPGLLFINDNSTFHLVMRGSSTSTWQIIESFAERDWREFNVPIPFHLRDSTMFEFAFWLLNSDAQQGLPSIPGEIIYLDDVGVGRAEDAAISYRPVSGTSFAAPFVSGAVALLASHRPELDYLEIRRAILDNVRRTPTWEPLVASGGILDLAAALASVTSPDLTVTPPHPVFISGKPTTLTIALTREPGADSDATDDDQVIVRIVGGDPAVVNIQPPTLTFTAENWHIPQPVTVTVTGPDDTTLRLGVEPNGSDDLYHDVTADIPLDSLDVSRVRLTPGIVTPGEAVTATVELNAAAPAPIAVTLTLTVNMPAYSTEVTGRIAIGERLATFTLTPAPAITAPVSAQIALTAIRTDTGTPLGLPQLPTLRIVLARLRLRLRVFLEGALQ